MFFASQVFKTTQLLIISVFAGISLMSSAALSADPLEQDAVSYSPQWYIALQGAYGPALNGAGWEGNFGERGEVSFDKAYVAGFSVGRFLDENWRVGVELNLFGFENESVSTNIIGTLPLSGSVNGVYGFVDVGYETMFSDRIGGFVEAGIGFVNISSDNMVVDPAGVNVPLSGSTTTLAGKIGAGLKYVMNENIDLFGKYSYIHADDAQWTAPGGGGGFSSELQSHAVIFGIRLKM